MRKIQAHLHHLDLRLTCGGRTNYVPTKMEKGCRKNSVKLGVCIQDYLFDPRNLVILKQGHNAIRANKAHTSFIAFSVF